MLSIIIPSHNEPKVEDLKADIFKMFPKAEVITVTDKKGTGKGAALYRGLVYAKGNLVCFIDGDMDIAADQIVELLRYSTQYDVVLGTKHLTNLPLRRKILSKGYKWLIKSLFNLDCDTQTGIKLFHRYALPEWVTDGYAFDVEILSKIKKSGYTVVEIPIECTISKQKSLGIVIRMFIDTIKIWLAS